MSVEIKCQDTEINSINSMILSNEQIKLIKEDVNIFMQSIADKTDIKYIIYPPHLNISYIIFIAQKYRVINIFCFWPNSLYRRIDSPKIYIDECNIYCINVAKSPCKYKESFDYYLDDLSLEKNEGKRYYYIIENGIRKHKDLSGSILYINIGEKYEIPDISKDIKNLDQSIVKVDNDFFTKNKYIPMPFLLKENRIYYDYNNDLSKYFFINENIRIENKYIDVFSSRLANFKIPEPLNNKNSRCHSMAMLYMLFSSKHLRDFILKTNPASVPYEIYLLFLCCYKELTQIEFPGYKIAKELLYKYYDYKNVDIVIKNNLKNIKGGTKKNLFSSTKKNLLSNAKKNTKQVFLERSQKLNKLSSKSNQSRNITSQNKLSSASSLEKNIINQVLKDSKKTATNVNKTNQSKMSAPTSEEKELQQAIENSIKETNYSNKSEYKKTFRKESRIYDYIDVFIDMLMPKLGAYDDPNIIINNLLCLLQLSGITNLFSFINGYNDIKYIPPIFENYSLTLSNLHNLRTLPNIILIRHVYKEDKPENKITINVDKPKNEIEIKVVNYIRRATIYGNGQHFICEIINNGTKYIADNMQNSKKVYQKQISSISSRYVAYISLYEKEIPSL